MPEPLLTFQRFNDIALANAFAEKLDELGIAYSLENESAPFDATFANNPLEDDIRIKLHPEDFAKANAALDEYYRNQLESIDKDYYLFSFTDNELEEIVRRPDEWNRLDYQLALKLLKDRGIEIQPEVIESYQQRRLTVLSGSENMSFKWVYIGYASAVIGGFLGIIVGLLLLYAKKTLPDGRSVYLNNNMFRYHGKLILIISAVSTITWLIVDPLGWSNQFFRFRYPYH